MKSSNENIEAERLERIMRIGIGCDHGGYEMKEELKKRLDAAGHTVLDKGIYCVNEVDYPEVAVEVADGVVAGEYDCAVLVCGTGIGMSIAANKVKGIRAALVTDTFSARMAKEHNNANVITLGARTVGIELAWELVSAYLGAEFLGGKHLTRVEKIMGIE